MTDSISALTALLGGTAFRLGISFLMERYKEYQDHKLETERMRLQDSIEEAQALRHLKLLEGQKNLGVTQTPVESSKEDFSSFQLLSKEVTKPTGFTWLDMWNSAVRPALATFCIVVWGAHIYSNNWVLGAWDLELISATLGIFIGSRISGTGR